MNSYSYQAYSPSIYQFKTIPLKTTPAGLEPTTLGLEGQRSTN